LNSDSGLFINSNSTSRTKRQKWEKHGAT
jgi:hypothetical protein